MPNPADPVEYDPSDASLLKTCAACGEEKPHAAFFGRKRNSGRIYPQSECRECHKVRNRESYHRIGRKDRARTWRPKLKRC